MGAFIRGAFGVPKADPEAIARIKDWARAALGGSPDTAFAVNEIACMDPACPGVETVILVMEPGVKTRACKVAKGLADVTQDDILEALAS
nr:hypothetical protein [Microvirga antarctica]